MISQETACIYLRRLYCRYKTWGKVAEKIGYSAGLISKWKNRKEPISEAGLIRIENAMDGKKNEESSKQWW